MIFAHIILILFNLLNSRIDAYKIERLKKSIRHGINGGAYLITVGLCVWLFGFKFWPAVVFVLSAFFNRQIFFDIPLNWRRGLSWDYMSTAKPPKAIWDRIEQRLVGYNGAAITKIYAVALIIFTVLSFKV